MKPQNLSSTARRLWTLSIASTIFLLGGMTSHAAKILYVINSVVDPVTTANAHDQEVRDRLVGQGHVVTLTDDTTVAPSETTGMDLVLISSSCGSGEPGVNPLCKNTLRAGRIPVICYEPALADELGLQTDTTYGNANGHTSLGIVGANKSHPLAAGKSGIVDIVALGDSAVVSSSAFPLTIGKEALLIATNATVGVDEGRVAIWAYDTGSHLVDNTTVVPSRRVEMFFNASTAPGSYNDVAYALFDAAIKWALESAPKAPPPTVAITSPANGTKFPAGAAVTITATAAKTGGTITKVEFFQGAAKIGEATQSPYTFTWSKVPDGRYTLTAKATDNSNDFGVSAEINIIVGTPPAEALFVIGGLPGNASELAIMSRLRAAGLVVTPWDDDSPVPAGINDRSLILVCSTSGSGNITKYRDVPVPIINWEWAAYDGLGIADADGASIDNSETQIEIVDAKHPLAAGLPAGLRTIFSAPAAQLASVDAIPTAKIVALAADGSGRAVLLAIEKGDPLSEAVAPGPKAPARRVGFFLGGDTFNGLNADGLKIFDAAVRWALGRAASPPTVSITSPADKATFAAGASVSITASAASSGGTITKVEFFDAANKIGEATASPYTITWSNAPTGRHALTAKVTDNANDSATSAPVNIVVGTPPELVLFVIGTDSVPNLNASDAGIKARLESLGFEVKVLNAPASTTGDANGTALIITSSTVNSGDVADKFRSSPIPVLNWEQALQDNYLMTTDEGTTHGTTDGQTQVNIVKADHPLAAGLSAGLKTVTTAAQPYSWGVPGPSATIVATIADDPTHALIYAYEKGAALIDGTTKAPERRVHFLAGNDGYAALTDDGKKLFDAALSFALNRTLGGAAPKFNPLTRQANNLTISWTGTGKLQQADSVSGPWNDAPSQNNPQTVSIATGAKFYRIRQ